MAADRIAIDRTKQAGNQTVRLANLLQECANLCDNLKENADHAWDTGQYGQLEGDFGLGAGAGANFLTLMGNLQTALGDATIVEFRSRVANQ